MYQQKIILNFTPYQIRVSGALAVITGSNGINFFDLVSKRVTSTIPLATENYAESIAFHPAGFLAAVAGKPQTLIIDLKRQTLIHTMNALRGQVAFDNLTGALILATRRNLGIDFETVITLFDQAFLPVATTQELYGPGGPLARNGQVLLYTTSTTFTLFRLPSLERIRQKVLPANATTNAARFSGHNLVVFGPHPQGVPQGVDNFLSFHDLNADLTVSLPLSAPADTKAVTPTRVYLTLGNKLTTVDISQRKVIATEVLNFNSKDLDFYPAENALVALDRDFQALWIAQPAA